MLLGAAIQQPSERISYTISYERALPCTDTIVHARATVTPQHPHGHNLEVVSLAPFAQRTRFFIEGGKNSQTYKVEITSRTREGRIFQDEIRLKIKEF